MGSFNNGGTPKKSAMPGGTDIHKIAVGKIKHACLKDTTAPINVKRATTPNGAI
jgi:hypothetical protein